LYIYAVKANTTREVCS